MPETMLTHVALERQLSPIQAKLGGLTRAVAALPHASEPDSFAHQKDRIVSQMLAITDWIGEFESRLPVNVRDMQPNELPVLYLAVPYSHPRKTTREARFRQANEAAAWLMRQGYRVISPISMGHPVAEAGPLSGGFETWRNTCLHLLDAADALCVLRVPGVAESIGVATEYRHAVRRGLPVSVLTPIGKSYNIQHNAALTFGTGGAGGAGGAV
jgi:Domain of unknown function (DUF1937).